MYQTMIIVAILLNVGIIVLNTLYILPLRRAFRKLERKHTTSIVMNTLFMTAVNTIVGSNVLDEKDGAIIITNRDIFEKLLKQYENKNTEIRSAESA